MKQEQVMLTISLCKLSFLETFSITRIILFKVKKYPQFQTFPFNRFNLYYILSLKHLYPFDLFNFFLWYEHNMPNWHTLISSTYDHGCCKREANLKCNTNLVMFEKNVVSIKCVLTEIFDDINWYYFVFYFSVKEFY